ncbi:steroid 17-alpha-hydroxylase/17,20 lyase-like [Asterias amurensis]|uniref:steroid 17-alpha-hydroxylase/17,20 lyase-like n=1 Tax=Asterias amurensis TaxID=7602 RepID=UPI003AB2F043
MFISAAIGGDVATNSLFQITGTTIILGATVVVLVVLLVVCIGGGNHRGENPPPSPPAHFLLGHLKIMSSSPPPPWVTLDKIGKEYGDVMSLKVGHWAIMLNTFAAIKDAALNYAKEMGSRPVNYSSNMLNENGKDISLGAYSPDWVLLREMGIRNLRDFTANKKIEKIAHVVFKKLEEDLDQREGKPVNIKDIVIPAVAGVLSHLCFGFEADASVHKRVSKLMGGDLYTYIVGPRNKADVIPSLRHIPSSGIRFIKNTTSELNGLLRSEFKRHKESLDPENLRDLMDGVINARNLGQKADPEKYKFMTDTHVYQVVSNYLGGTTAGFIVASLWSLTLMVANPEKQEKIASEVTSVVGEDRKPGLDDRDSLVYVSAAIEEILRYACIAPLSVPHKTTQDITFRGYSVPKDTSVLANFYGLHFNEEFWPAPFEYKPERFIDEGGNFQSKEHMFPFGYGVRACPAQPEARQLVYLILSWLTHRYAITRVPGEEQKDILQQDPQVQVARAPAPFDVILQRRF